MDCPRCRGLMWACVMCGGRLDHLILHNRQQVLNLAQELHCV